MQRQGAWACEAYTASSSSQLIETLGVLELKDGVGEVDSSSDTGSHQSLSPLHLQIVLESIYVCSVV